MVYRSIYTERIHDALYIHSSIEQAPKARNKGNGSIKKSHIENLDVSAEISICYYLSSLPLKSISYGRYRLPVFVFIDNRVLDIIFSNTALLLNLYYSNSKLNVQGFCRFSKNYESRLRLVLGCVN